MWCQSSEFPSYSLSPSLDHRLCWKVQASRMKEDISWMYTLWNSWFWYLTGFLRSLCTNLLVCSNNKLLCLGSPTGIKTLTSPSLQFLLWFPVTSQSRWHAENIKQVTSTLVVFMTTIFVRGWCPGKVCERSDGLQNLMFSLNQFFPDTQKRMQHFPTY